MLLILTGAGLFVTAFYLSLTGAFGGFFKYPYPVFPILILVVAHHFHDQIFMKNSSADLIKISHLNKTMNIGHNQIIIFLFGGVALIVGYFQLVYARDSVIMKGTPVGFPYMFILIGIAIAIGVLAAKKPESVLYKYGLTILFAVMLGTQLGISRSQAVATYPTKYHYGQIFLLPS